MSLLRNDFFRDNDSSKPEEAWLSVFFHTDLPTGQMSVIPGHKPPALPLWPLSSKPFCPWAILTIRNFPPSKSHQFLPFAVARVTQAP